MATKTETISRFLLSHTHADLAQLYNAGMECQVNVAQDEGQFIAGEFKGKRWQGWTDQVSTWKPFRIPRDAGTVPVFEDSEIKFDFASHVEGIGLTGWDWQNKVSRWVAFDFDAITGHSDKHSKKLTDEELQEIKRIVIDIPWLTLRASTGGKGLHIYVFLTVPVPTATHTEHAALARAILAQLSAFCKFDFISKVDTCGGNMWVWHRKMTEANGGLKLVKLGSTLDDIPPNWQAHMKAVRKVSKHCDPFVEGNSFEELCGKLTHTALDDEHKKLIDYLRTNKAYFWWDSDRHMLVCHTYDLLMAHKALNFRGPFETLSTGKEVGIDQNCFCFPLKNGGWVVRRHSPGCAEAKTWFLDTANWTRCFYNKLPDLQTACISNGAVENEKGAYVFRELSSAIKALADLGITVVVPVRYLTQRATELLAHPKEQGKIILRFTQLEGDPVEEMPGWLVTKSKWTRIFSIKESNETETKNYDEAVRHLVTETGDNCGWVVRPSGRDIWQNEPLTHIKAVLESLGNSPKQVTTITGTMVLNRWILVNRPFGPEYIGNRQWNLNAAKIKFAPSIYSDSLKYPHWDMILEHIGKELDYYILQNAWCKNNGISSGRDYLKCWIASMFQSPLEPLPYLFLYGDQNTGKSILHEALSLLMTSGYQRADIALTNDSSFNGELENAVLCVVEETDLSKHKGAYNKIKDWVTSRQLNIRAMYKEPYHVPNSTHWIQCSNEHTACPTFPGDTRITMIRVNPLDPIDLIPKRQLITLLEKEAPDFISEILHLELPSSNDRLALPVIETSEKAVMGNRNKSTLARFIDEHCYRVKGECVSFSDFYDKFWAYLETDEQHHWSKIRVGRELPPDCPKGRSTTDNGKYYIGNISFEDKKGGSHEFVLDNREMLRTRSIANPVSA